MIFSQRNIGKKGVSVWLSWVLLFTFAVAISAVGFRFIIPIVEKSTIDLKKVVFNTDECRQIAISVEGACQDNSAQVLNITIRNRNYIRIDKLTFQVFGAGNQPLFTNHTTSKHGPQREKVYSIPTNTSGTITFATITPRIFREDLEIVCQDRGSSVTTIPSC